jgi:hypothetical protein
MPVERSPPEHLMTVDEFLDWDGGDGNWPAGPVASGAGGTAHLTTLDLDLAVAEIYEGTLLEAAAAGV